MNLSTIQTPGVYINEVNGFPNSVVAVATAIPAFIGYTPQASYEGKSYLNVPVQITSFADFQAFFCYPDPAPPASPAKQYSPEYYLVQEKTQPTS
ncbi:MAG TPA: phage tail sheath family protein, partial [Bacteroidia bacterium]|nr:phage tail sheath family protein [Bacteroidia bacterium]